VFAFVVSKRAAGDDKVIRFRLTEQQGRLSAVRELQFGRELSVGQETVMVDEERELVLVADENQRDIKVYGTDGKWRSTFGQGAFEAQVEGIVIARCGEGGYIIASDQKELTEFEIFDRATFKHLGTVRGAAQRTDGIALTQAALPDYPRGLFVAQSDPEDTGGRHAEFYDFGQLLEGAGLRSSAPSKSGPDCPAAGN
jgi:myo-inositol-hexaphosphate 3-phosphohydrolase